MKHYATYFDHRYLPQGLALHRSMRRQLSDFRLWVLALTPECERELRRIRPQGVEMVPLAELEKADPEFMRSRENRSLVEYYFTSTPCFLHYLLQKNQGIGRISYLDADMFYFSDPRPVEREVEASSIAITPHRFRPELEGHRKYGFYNVGWLSFRADSTGKECLAEWRRQCLEWCRDEPESGRFGDQGYLDGWPKRYRGIRVMDQPGFNEAPWNVEVLKLTKKDGRVFIGNHPLVLFHFQGLRRLGSHIFNPNWHDYHLPPSRKLIHWVYRPYLASLLRVEGEAGLKPAGQSFIRGQEGGSRKKHLWKFFWGWGVLLKLASRNYLYART